MTAACCANGAQRPPPATAPLLLLHLQRDELRLPLPAFIQEEPQQHELRQGIFGKAKQKRQDSGPVSQGGNARIQEVHEAHRGGRALLHCSQYRTRSAPSCCFRLGASLLCSSAPDLLTSSNVHLIEASVGRLGGFKPQSCLFVLLAENKIQPQASALPPNRF